MENGFALAALLALLASSGCGVATLREGKAIFGPESQAVGSEDGTFSVDEASFTYTDAASDRQLGRILQVGSDVWVARHVSGELIYSFSPLVADAQISGAGVFAGAKVEFSGARLRVLPDWRRLDLLSGAACLAVTLSNGTHLRMTLQYAAGDFNLDGMVDDADAQDMFWALGGGGKAVTSEFHAAFDLKSDGKIDSADYAAFLAAYNEVIPDLNGGCAP
jgi:hypothetical protein